LVIQYGKYGKYNNLLINSKPKIIDDAVWVLISFSADTTSFRPLPIHKI